MPKKSLALGIVLILIVIAASLINWRSNIQLATQIQNTTSTNPTNSGQATSTNPNNEQPVILTSIANNSIVSSPLTVTGKAKGTWFFEATLPVKLIDANGTVIARVGAQATSDWMTTDYVPFTATLTFASVKTPTGSLVISKDNPSGLPQNDASISIPVRFASVSTSTVAVKLYYPNTQRANQIGDPCNIDSIQPVDREIPVTKTPIKDTINLLISGQITGDEKAAGFTTEYPNAGFKLQSASVKGTTLTLEFSDTKNFTSGGSCRVGILANQIIKTAKQFDGITNVVLKPAELFQP